MLFFLRMWCYFSSSAVAVLVGISQFKHIYASELQLSTRFPFHCQDRFPRQLKRGSENDVEKRLEKVIPKGPQMDPKNCQKLIKACYGGVSKGDLKKGPSPGSGKVRFCYYLLHFTGVARSEVSNNVIFWVPFLGQFWRQNHENRVPEQHQKKRWK